MLWRPKDRGAADTMGSACSPWVTLADPGGGGWDGSCWHLAPCMSASPLGAFPRSAPDLALGVPPPLVPSFSPSLLRPVPRGGARLPLPDRELSVFGRGLRQARGDSLLHGSTGASHAVLTRPGRGPGRVSGVWTLCYTGLCTPPGPHGEHPAQHCPSPDSVSRRRPLRQCRTLGVGSLSLKWQPVLCAGRHTPVLCGAHLSPA